MKKTADLCGRCAALLGQEYDVRKVAGGRDHKVTCQQCGLRRYGGTYEIGRRQKL